MSEKRSSGVGPRGLRRGPPDAVPVLEALLHAPVSVVGVVTVGPGTAADADLELRRLVEDATCRCARPRPGSSLDLQWMQDLGPDLLVCAGWTVSLPVPVLALAPRGTAVIHPSLLPAAASPLAGVLGDPAWRAGDGVFAAAPGPRPRR